MFITVKAACMKEFHIYTHKLAAMQDLDCIVFNEAHLIITVFNYCQTMVDLTLIQHSTIVRPWLI